MFVTFTPSSSWPRVHEFLFNHPHFFQIDIISFPLTHRSLPRVPPTQPGRGAIYPPIHSRRPCPLNGYLKPLFRVEIRFDLGSVFASPWVILYSLFLSQSVISSVLNVCVFSS